MFKNHYITLKLGGAIILITVLSFYTRSKLDASYPDIVQCLSLPNEYDRCTVVTSHPSFVKKVYTDGFELEDEDGFKVRIIASNIQAGVGGCAIVLGKFRKEGYVVADRIRIIKNYRIKRGIVYIVSITVVVLLFLYAKRWFRADFENGLFK
jgi:hypothetical protein